MANNASLMVGKPWIAEGKTVVYGGSTFDPVVFMQNAAASAAARKEAEAKQRIARQAEWKDFKWDQYQPKEIYQQNRDQINLELDKFRDIMSEAFSQGLSPNDPAVRGTTEQIRARMVELENEGKLFNERYGEIISAIQKEPSKYDKAVIDNWKKEIDKLPTIQEKRAYVDANNPLEEMFDIKSELLEVDFPTRLETERQANPNFFVTEEGLDEAKTRSLVKELLLTPKYESQLAREVNALVARDNISHIDATEKVIKDYQDFIMNTGSTKREESGTPRQSNVFNFGGQGSKTGGVVAKPTTVTSVKGLGGSQKLAPGENAIRILTEKEETVLPKTFIKNEKREEYVPIQLVVIEEDGKKFFNIMAQKATKRTGIKTKQGEDEESFLSGLKKEYGAEAKIEKGDDDTYTVTYLTPQTELLEYNAENKSALPGAFVQYADEWLSKQSSVGNTGGAGRFNKK